MRLLTLGLVFVSAGTLFGQLTPEQRALDFQSLAAMFAKRYAPVDWKKQAFGYDVLDIKPWLARVSAAKDDLEFYEIEAEYVAGLNDVHTGFQVNSTFSASLGFTVDIYDGKVLIDSINRALLPARDYPFAIGDELISLDGKSAEDWITLISKYRQRANLSNTRRAAAGQITSRSQTVFPRASEVADSAAVEIRAAGGDVASYTIPWNKTGYAITRVGKLPMPKSKPAVASDVPEYLRFLEEVHTWKLPDSDIQAQPLPFAAPSEDGDPQKYTLSYGSRTPIFRAGLPSNFVVRRGLSSADFHYSGTYQANGHTIGYLRVPTFAPASSLTAVRELETEIDYFQKNTDGLVVDVMRNPGGGCYMIDVAAHLIPYPFYFFGEQIRPTQDRLNAYAAQLDLARLLQADQWVINTYERAVTAMEQAMADGQTLTDPIPACTQTNAPGAPTMEGNLPTPIVYTKPLIVLVDEFSTSAADIFPSMIQDNGRAPLVGHTTNGGGGSVSGYQTGFFSESYSTNTNSLVIRKNPIVTADYPTAPYVENIGARPEIPLEYMTKDNLLNDGKTFVQQFTDVLVGMIEKGGSN